MQETEETVNLSNYQETPEQATHVIYSETPEQSTSKSYVEVPAATVSSNASEVAPAQNDEPSRENRNIDGDLTVQNNVSIGGVLRAKRIVHPWGCLFHSLNSLKTEFPKPFPGMWAIVGSTFPFDVYRCRITGGWELVMPCSLSSQISQYLTENKYATQEWVLGEIGKIKIPASLTIGDVSQYLIDNKYLKEGDVTLGEGGCECEQLFEKVTLSGGGYAIRAKYALYSNQWISCLGPNPDAGTIVAGATTLGALNNVTDLADSTAAADKVLVLRAGATSWSLANLSDIVGLDTAALSLYLSQHNYVTTADIPDLNGYLQKATFDDLFEKVTLSSGQTAIRAKYAFYTNEWMSCLGANPDAGTVALGATTLGGLNNVVAAADESSAAAKVLVREAGASEWGLRNLSDIVGLDTTALATYLTNNHYAKTSDIPSLAGYLQRSVADTLYQPIGDYATSADLSSAVTSLTAMVSGKLDASVFDDLFVKEADGKGGYRIKARYALYSNQYLSCLGNNPDAGTVELGATTLGGLNNVAAAADEVSAAAKVLVREAGAASWTLKSLSDIVGLDTAALATYLSSNGYAKQSWVEAKGYLTQHQSLAGYATKTWVEAKGYLTAITKAQVEAVLTGNITSHTHSQYLTSVLAAQTYQPIGDYATNTALNSAVSSLNTAIGKKLDAATFDDLFVKEADGKGGYRIRAKYAFYSNQYISCLGNNPDAGTTTPSTPGVDLDAVADYLTQQGYATQAWVQAQGYLKAADLSAYALADNAYLKSQQNRKSNAHTVASLTAVANSSDSWVNNYSFSLVNNNNVLNFYVGGVQNERQALIQSGHSSNGFAQVLGALHLNKLGGAVYINNSLALNVANVGSYAVTLDTAQTIAGAKKFTAYETETGSRLTITGLLDTFANYPALTWHVAGKKWSRAVMDANGGIHFINGDATGLTQYRAIAAANFVIPGGTSSQFLKADGSVDGNSYLTAHQSLDYINNLGRLAAISGTTTVPSGLRLYQVYCNGYPSDYGNLLRIGGAGAGELFCSWRESNNAPGELYYRSKRDVASTPWTDWARLLTSVNYASVLDSRYVHGNYIGCGYGVPTLQWTWGSNLTHVVGFEGGNNGAMRVYNGAAIRAFANAVNKAGDTMTGALYIKMDTQPCLILNSVTANKEVYMYIYSGGAAKNAIGWSTTYGAYIYNSPSAKYLGIKDNGTPHFQGNTLWHAGNDGSGSGLDADLLDGMHSSEFNRCASPSWTNGETVQAWAKRLGWANPTLYNETNWGWAYSKSLTIGSYTIDSQHYSALDFRRGNLNEAWKQKAIMFLPTYGDSEMIYIAQMSVSGTGGEVTLNAVRRYATYDSILASNVASATKLQTARSLWGNSFNGTGDISGNINFTAQHSKIGLNISDQANDCPWYGLRLSCMEGWPVMLSGYYGTSLRSAGGMLSLAQSGNVGIGTTAPECKLHVVGVIKSSTGMYSDGYMSCLGQNTGSDARLKNIMGDVTLPIEVILNAPAVRFAWNASAGPTMAAKMAVGTIAQYWLDPLPEVVGLLPTDYYGLDYEGLNWVATKSLARYAYDGLTDHERRILELEHRCIALEQDNSRMRAENEQLRNRLNQFERRLVA